VGDDLLTTELEQRVRRLDSHREIVTTTSRHTTPLSTLSHTASIHHHNNCCKYPLLQMDPRDALHGVVNNQIRKGLLLNLSANYLLKLVNIWQSYKQERDCLVHFLRLLVACCSGAQSALDNHVLACNFAKYSPI